MYIAADARILELSQPTGVERSFAELLRSIPRAVGAGDEVVAYTRSDVVATEAPALRAIGGPASIALWRETSLVRTLSKTRADVLWSPVAAIPLRTGVPCVATFHEAPWLVRPGMEGVVRESVHRARVGIAARRAVRIVCPSQASAAQLAQLHPSAKDRIRVVPHGVACRFRELPEPASAARLRAALGVPSRPYFLHVGGDRPRKNVGLLFTAYERFRAGGGAAGLELVGPGPGPEGLPAGASFRGYVTEAQLLALYAGALALVISSDAEGFGLPVLEAMAAGVPVVSTTAGALDEVAAGAARSVEPGDAAGLARALLEIERDEKVRAELVRRGSARVRGASWDRSAELLLAVLREAAATR